MPTYRKLHVKTRESLDVNDLPDDFTRLFWVLLPLALCRQGCGLDNAAWLKSNVFPIREDITQDAVYRAFECCVERGMIERYEQGGRKYFYVPSFARYQGDTSKEAKSPYPPPPVESKSGVSPEPVESRSGTDADADAAAEAATDAYAAAAADPHAAAAAREEMLDEAEEFGFGRETAVEMLETYGIEALRWVISDVRGQKGIGSPTGLVITKLRDGDYPSPRAPPTMKEILTKGYEGVIQT